MAIDPGGSSGYATLALDQQTFYVHVWKDVPDMLHHIVAHKPQYLIVEDFQTSQYLSPQARQVILTIGSLIGLSVVLEVPIRIQAPSRRKAFIREATDLLGKAVTPHEIDALAHLLSVKHTGDPLSWTIKSKV